MFCSAGYTVIEEWIIYVVCVVVCAFLCLSVSVSVSVCVVCNQHHDLQGSYKYFLQYYDCVGLAVFIH
jgi:hypothetical protein